MAVDTTLNNSAIQGVIDPNGEMWSGYLDDTLVSESELVSCEGPQNLAADVLEVYNIVCATPSIGGPITDIDIKRMDARTVLNWSLLEYSAREGSTDDGFYEPFVTSDNEVEFKKIGSYSGQVTDIYYTVAIGDYRTEPKGVMVTGGRPLPTRKPLQWLPIWGEGPANIYSMSDVFNNCHKRAFSRYATIVFQDPHLENSQYNDRIDNLYDITDENKYDRILGYVKYKKAPDGLIGTDTTIQYANQCSIPIKIGEEQSDGFGPYMGTLQDPPVAAVEAGDQECYSNFGETVSPSDGVVVNIPDEFRFEDVRETVVDKFIGISAVYVIGREISLIDPSPVSDADTLLTGAPENTKLWISIDDYTTKTFRLDEGKQYAVAYEGDPETGEYVTPYIVFARDVRRNDNLRYGMSQNYFIDPLCDYAIKLGIDESTEPKTGTILPVNGKQGILVEEIWVTADMETPCIVIEDPDGRNDRALEIARNLQYYVAPIVVEEYPNTMAYAGISNNGRYEIVESPIYDKDPTTAQSFEDTRFEEILDEMAGGNGMSITFAFLNDPDRDTREELVGNMAERLYNFMNDDVTEVVYTCGPECDPQLGGYGLTNTNSIINSIRYSYTDSGSYTISVTEGPKVVSGLSQVDGGPAEFMNEDISARGTIIDSRGDNIHFKVRIDGFGERWAVSMTHETMRIGDVVNCAIHNCPIER